MTKVLNKRDIFRTVHVVNLWPPNWLFDIPSGIHHYSEAKSYLSMECCGQINNSTLMVLALYWFWLVNFDLSESQLVQFGHLVVSMTWISRCWSTGYCLHLFRWVFSKLLLQLLHRRALITQFPPSTVLTLHIECWNYPSSSTDEFTILIPLLLISYFFSQDSVNDDGPPVPSHKQVCVVTVC